MREIVTAERMRQIERTAFETGRVTGLELMERAGAAAVEAALDEWPELRTPGRAVVLCGPGNNGGDGYVVARLLAERGWSVTVCSLGDPGRLRGDAREAMARWTARGPVTDMEAEDWSAVHAPIMAADLVVDAVFGIGLSRPFAVPPQVGMAMHSIFADGTWAADGPSCPRVVALDVPSGLDADSGAMMARTPEGDPMAAHLTVAFGHAKPGHYLAEGPGYCGALRVADIGLDRIAPPRRPGVRPPPDGTVFRIEPPWGPFAASTDRWLGKGAPGPEAARHKYDHGHALVLTGGMGRTGAARLAARGALRAGAGLVTLGAPGAAMLECAAQITALMLTRCDDGTALEGILGDARISALCLGPGLGLGERGQGLVEAALASGRPCVLDADALTLIAREPALADAVHADCVLTPHDGEFARLFPDIAERLETVPEHGPAYSRIDAARDAAARIGATVLLKGPATVVAHPDGRCALNAALYERAAPWLATAGSGDVLAGIAAGLMARRSSLHLDPFDATCAAAWLHVEAALAFGPGLVAKDLPEMLPRVLRAPED